jgi:hypothetical protein
MRKMKVASNGDKDPIANLTEKLRGLFGFGDYPKNNNTLPPKRRFNIWYREKVSVFSR